MAVRYMLTAQAKGPESDFQYSCKMFDVWCMPVMSALGRYRQMDLWSLLTRQPGLLGKFQTSERPCLK